MKKHAKKPVPQFNIEELMRLEKAFEKLEAAQGSKERLIQKAKELSDYRVGYLKEKDETLYDLNRHIKRINKRGHV